MKRIFLILAAMLAVTLVQAQNNIEEEISRHLVRANVCIEMNFIDDAIKEYEEIVKIAPNWPNVYMYLGNSYSQKGDNASIGKAIEYYNKFLQMTNDQELYQEARNKLSRLEMMAEIKADAEAKSNNLVGTWKTNWYNKYSGKPLFVFEITETPTPGKYQIKLSPQGVYFDDVVNKVAYSNIIDDKIAWNTTFQKTYIPKQSKYVAMGGFLNYLAGDMMLLSVAANSAVDYLKEKDVAYTDFREYNFTTDINMIKAKFQDNFDDGFEHDFLSGNVQIKFEHHQDGINRVIADSITDCYLVRGDDIYPVFLKIEKQGKKYIYGDLIGKKSDLNYFLALGGYVDNELNSLKKTYTAEKVGKITLACGSACLLPAILTSVIIMYKNPNSNSIYISYGCLGLAAVGGIIWGCSKAHEMTFYKKLIKMHNLRVDQKRESMKKEISFGMTPTGVGMSLNF